ncbi:MAG TPA: Crp/Fnr family transcriptional regulator [Puia sp.]|nr:Crp/Fnr family transcriptional regulator [Puia sp.]
MANPLLAFLQLYRPLSEKDQALIAADFEPRTYREGETLFKGGRTCQEMFFVTNGVLRILATNEKGIDVTHFFTKENQFCTILHSFNNQTPANESIQAACDADVLSITRTRLLALYEKIPYMKELIDQILQQRLLDKIQTRNAYLGEDSVSRYKLFIRQQPDIALRVALKDIASYLGITPQSLSRIRKNIK